MGTRMEATLKPKIEPLCDSAALPSVYIEGLCHQTTGKFAHPYLLLH